MHGSHLPSSISSWSLGLERQRHSNRGLWRFSAQRWSQDPRRWQCTCCCTSRHYQHQRHHLCCQSSLIGHQCQSMQQPHLSSGFSSRSHQSERRCHPNIRCKPRQPPRSWSQPLRWWSGTHYCHRRCRYWLGPRRCCHYLGLHYPTTNSWTACTNRTMGSSDLMDVHCSWWLGSLIWWNDIVMIVMN